MPRAQRKKNKKRSLLILVDGDPTSRDVEREAKRAGFSGQIVTFSEADAREQHTPLPLLIEDGMMPIADYALLDHFRKMNGKPTLDAL